MTEQPDPSQAGPNPEHLRDLIGVIPAAAVVVTSWIVDDGAAGVFQADVAGLATIAAVGAFAIRLRARSLAVLGLAALLVALAHVVAGGGWSGVLSQGILALGVGAGATGLAALGRALGATATAAAVVANAVLVTAMLGLSWADPLGDRLPHAKRYAFKQAVLHLDAATACAYDAAGLDRFHEHSVYDRVKLASGAVTPPEAVPTGTLWLLFGVLTGAVAFALGADRPARASQSALPESRA